MAASFLELAWCLLVGTTAALAAALLLRVPIRSLAGSRIAYAFWIVVPVTTICALLPVGRLVRAGSFPEASRLLLPPEAIQRLANVEVGFDVETWILTFWLIGAAVFLLVQVRRQRVFTQSLGPLLPAPTGEWTTQANGFGPAVVGVFPSRVVLPADFRERYTAQERELILAHEWAHVRRHDPAMNLVIASIRSLLWFHPLAHVAARYVRMDQELACDAAVIAERPTSRHDYAHIILKTQLFDSEGAAACHWESETASFLARRFAMLQYFRPSPLRRFAGVTSIIVATAAIATVAWAAQPRHNFSLRDLAVGPDIVILINGKRTSRTNLDGIPLSRIERIEVLPERASAVYGTNPAKGVINIVLKN